MKQTGTLEVSRLRGATLIKLIILGSGIGCTLLATVFGVAALFGVEIVQWNGQYITGLKGLLASPFVGAFVGLMFGTMTAALAYVGLRFFSLFSGVSIEYVPVDQQAHSTTSEAG